MNKSIFVAVFFIAGEAFASGIQTGTVAEIRVSSRTLAFGNPTHVRLQNVTTNSPLPTCATSGFWAIDTDTPIGKNMLAVLLTAEAASPPKTVILWGSGQCDLRGDMETIAQVSISP